MGSTEDVTYRLRHVEQEAIQKLFREKQWDLVTVHKQASLPATTPSERPMDQAEIGEARHDKKPSKEKEGPQKAEVENTGIPPLKEGQDYHAFIAHSSQDVELAYTILEELEQQRGFKCFMAARDFIPGQSTVNSIQTGITKSARVIMLFSKAFLKSEWQTFETVQALTKTSETGQRILIPVLLDDVTLDDLPNYLKGTHYAEYKAEDFWRKLYTSIVVDVPLSMTLPAGNVAHGLAWSYFYGYLNLVLPGLKERVEQSKFWQSDPSKRTILYKMMIFLPESCYCPGKLIDLDKKHFSHEENDYIQFKTTRAGNINRDYKSSVYTVKDPDTNEEFKFLAEFATPLLSLYEMEQGTIAGLTSEQKLHQRKLFAEKLKEILEHGRNQGCHNHYVISDFKDASLKEGDFARIVVRRIRHELQLEVTTNQLDQLKIQQHESSKE